MHKSGGLAPSCFETPCGPSARTERVNHLLYQVTIIKFAFVTKPFAYPVLQFVRLGELQRAIKVAAVNSVGFRHLDVYV